MLHASADEITANSESGRNVIAQSWSWLAPRVHVIYNAVDLHHFVPSRTTLEASTPVRRTVRLVALASHQKVKNLSTVLRAMLHIRRHETVHLRWYGGTREDLAPHKEAHEFVRANGLEGTVELLPPTKDPRQAYWDSDAVLLASFFEGCPNVICEAMACGKPVLASAVSDNPLIVEDGVSGLLFDPNSAESIAAAIAQFARLDPAKSADMGRAGRRRAEQLFDPDVCARRYEDLLLSAAHRRGRSTCVLRKSPW